MKQSRHLKFMLCDTVCVEKIGQKSSSAIDFHRIVQATRMDYLQPS